MRFVGSIGYGVLLGVAVLSAQARPDFSGTWVSQPSQAGAGVATAGGMRSGGGGGGGMGAGTAGGGAAEMRIVQTATSLTIERTAGANVLKYVHSFDGTENVNVNGSITLRTKSRWEDGKLITEGSQVFHSDTTELTMDIREIRSLRSDGTLQLETERTREGNTRKSLQLYRKK